ncbi:MAG: hypothetical protein PHX27_04635, partial [Candidatus ainarchaeum sp.]|nr:hypothetical protein [Candidatus ainarchaeum sp.]
IRNSKQILFADPSIILYNESKSNISAKIKDNEINLLFNPIDFKTDLLKYFIEVPSTYLKGIKQEYQINQTINFLFSTEAINNIESDNFSIIKRFDPSLSEQVNFYLIPDKTQKKINILEKHICRDIEQLPTNFKGILIDERLNIPKIIIFEQGKLYEIFDGTYDPTLILNIPLTNESNTSPTKIFENAHLMDCFIKTKNNTQIKINSKWNTQINEENILNTNYQFNFTPKIIFDNNLHKEPFNVVCRHE